jgi:hypothetical protein
VVWWKIVNVADALLQVYKSLDNFGGGSVGGFGDAPALNYFKTAKRKRLFQPHRQKYRDESLSSSRNLQ